MSQDTLVLCRIPAVFDRASYLTWSREMLRELSGAVGIVRSPHGALMGKTSSGPLHISVSHREGMWACRLRSFVPCSLDLEIPLRGSASTLRHGSCQSDETLPASMGSTMESRGLAELLPLLPWCAKETFLKLYPVPGDFLLTRMARVRVGSWTWHPDARHDGVVVCKCTCGSKETWIQGLALSVDNNPAWLSWSSIGLGSPPPFIRTLTEGNWYFGG